VPAGAGVPCGVRDPALAMLADRLLLPDNSLSLISALEEALDELGALPARLYLRDPVAGVFYAAAGLGCERDAPDLAPEAATGPRCLELRAEDAATGVLMMQRDPPPDPRLDMIEALLGPVLVALHRRQATAEELQLAEDQLRLVTTAGDLLRHMELEVLLVKILETTLGAVRAQVGAVLTPDLSGTLQAQVSWGLRPGHVAGLRLRDGRILPQVVHKTATTMAYHGDEVAEHLDLSGLEARVTGLVALPLTTRGQALGVVLAVNPEQGFGPSQRRMAETLCSLAAIALDNALLVKTTVDRERLRQELDLARNVQTGMFPVGPLTVGTVSATGSSRPCHETGGDYYTYLTRDGRMLALIGDVSGHGLGAALFTTMAHCLLHQQLRAGADLHDAFRVLNEGLYHAQSGRFMTAALVEIDPATGRFRYTSAGHNPLLWVHRGKARWLDSLGLPLGITGDATYPTAEPGSLEPGDRLILYTDGYTEAMDPAQVCFGEDRLAQTALNGLELDLAPTAFAALLDGDVDMWAQGQPHADDLTLVVITAG
jgi:phosphoserine phosphatase RsbU/P